MPEIADHIDGVGADTAELIVHVDRTSSHQHMVVWVWQDVLCTDCSHGNPDASHHHEPADHDQTLVGLAGTENELRDCLNDWRRDRPHLRLVDLQPL